MSRKVKLLTVCVALLSLSACAQKLIPQQGDLTRGDAHRLALKSLLESGALDSKAGEVHLDIYALPPRMRIETYRLSPKQYEGNVYATDAGRLKTPEDDFSYYCENIMGVVVNYTAVSEKSTAMETKNYKLTLRDGECARIKGKKIDVMLGTYTFNEPLSVQPAGSHCHPCMKTALHFYRRGAHMQGQNDVLVWEDAGMLVGESAGSVWYDGSSPIPHLLNFGGPGNNFYQLVLVGERSIVYVDVIYPLSMPLKKLQAETLPVIKALRYTALPGASHGQSSHAH